MSKQRILILILAGIFLAGGIFYFFNRPLAMVGETKINKRDASYRDKIVFLTFPEEKRSLGLYQLIKTQVNFEVMKKYGMNIQQSQLEKEEERIDKNTKDPEQLKKIKDVFGSDHDAYLKDFIQPNMVDHMIYYDLFLNDERIQKESLTAANEFIGAVKDHPKDFKQVANDKKIIVKELTLSLKKGMLWERDKNMKDERQSVNAQAPPGDMKIIDQSKKSKVAQKLEAEFAASNSTLEEAKKWHELVVQNMKEGTVSSAPLNREEAWIVLHLVKQKSKEEFLLEVAFFKKLDFSSWLEKEKTLIPIKIYDSSYMVPK